MPVDASHPTVAELRSDRIRGASQLARWSVERLGAFVADHDAVTPGELHEDLLALSALVRAARPSMSAVGNLVDRWLDTLPVPDTVDLEAYRRAAVARADQLIRDSEQASGRAAENAAALIGGGRTVMTHSMSSTVLACLLCLRPDVRVIVTASQPPGEGRILARTLSDAGVEVDFISDQQMAVFVARAHAVLVGADAVARDGSVVNKAGTHLLALAAKASGVPVYACFESLKRGSFAPKEVQLERRDPGELGLPTMPHVTVHNLYFDLTPPDLVSAWITEEGAQTEPPGPDDRP